MTPPLRAALLLAAATALLPPAPAQAAVLAAGLAVRAEGRAPIQGGRVDTAYAQALEEAFRRGLLEALRVIAPERQSPQDLETWQETVLPRAADFVGAWRILSQDDRAGFVTLEVEVEIWRDKLARAARGSRSAAAVPAARVVVLAEPLSLHDPAADEEIDAGRTAATALEAELARRGAVVVATTDQGLRPLWAAEDRPALAAALARRLGADAALLARVSRRDGGLTLAAHLVAAATASTLVSARADVDLAASRPLAEALAPAARQLAAACAPHLGAARGARPRGALP